ncbi:hypothetical protein SDC9_94719 [bioreactor metagenome]|uniref:Uncharacterized protein n=1 Tax=bioreactor metagenome TaxID=1076179 RepID=A0A645A5M6_9ZZZZ
MKRPEQAPDDALPPVPIPQMQQLMQQHLVVRLRPGRYCQHRAKHPADKGRRQPGKGYRAAGPQAVLPANAVNPRLHLCGRGTAMPEQQPQPSIENHVPQKQNEHSGGINHKKPVGHACRAAADPRNGKANPDGHIHRGIRGTERLLRKGLARLQP